MSTPPVEPTIQTLQNTLARAVQGELDQLNSARNEVTLFGGNAVGSHAGHYYYRFEIPEDLFLRGVERVACTFSQLQPVTIHGSVVSLENESLTIALPMDFGPLLPEVKCRWDHESHLKPVLEALRATSQDPSVVTALFRPASASNTHPCAIEPSFLSSTSKEEEEAVRKILRNRVSFVWGPHLSGKTQVLALAALAYLKANKTVLYVSRTNDRIDQMVSRASSLSSELGIDFTSVASRVGMPVKHDEDRARTLSLDSQVGSRRTQKSKEIEERATLLQVYWRTRISQFLHEDFYAKLADLREQSNENRKQLGKIADELKVLKETISRAQNASMLEKLKKGFNKEELAAAQKDLTEKQGLQKKLQAVQQALTTELIRAEAQVPIDSNELREYYAAAKRLGELGGPENVAGELNAALSVDERELLASKRFVASTVTGALGDPRLRNRRYDMVIVDRAESVPIPFLTALALMTGEKMIVAGDPFRLGPDSYSTGELAQAWLQRDIFLHIAETDQLHQLFEWSQQHAEWCIFLSLQHAQAPKLASFAASVLYDDKVKVAPLPGARGKIYFVDTTDLRSSCRQYIGRKRIVPANDVQTRKAIEYVKHALMQPQRRASDVAVVVPFSGTSLHTKLQLRANAIRGVEVGTPQAFQDSRKKAVIVDTVMAGVDYTMRQIDDRKAGEHRIARLFNTIFSCVEEDLYVLADLSHFKSIYKDRLFTKLLLLVQAHGDPLPAAAQSAKQFDELDWDVRAKILAPTLVGDAVATGDIRKAAAPAPQRADAELEVRMRTMAKQSQPVSIGVRNFERETYFAVHRVLGLRKDVNLLSQLVGGDVLFRSSLATEQAAIRLPLAVCQSEGEFRKIMEQWNLLIYEMSGAGKTDLSFFARQTPEASVRWDISNLRAYYSSTVEAVVEEGKHRVAVSVSKVFQECLGKSQPANPVEWSTAYLNFLGKMESYLSWIAEQLRK